MIGAVELEKRIANIHIFSVIIYKFCHEQELYPVVLLLINKNICISFHRTIMPLGPAVSLRIKYSGNVLFNVKEVSIAKIRTLG